MPPPHPEGEDTRPVKWEHVPKFLLFVIFVAIFKQLHLVVTEWVIGWLRPLLPL